MNEPVGPRAPAVDPGEMQRVRQVAAERDLPRWTRIDALYALRAGASAPIAIVVLLVTNAVPVVGVLLFRWDLWTILALYWAESGIVGALNIAKMAMARGAVMPANVTIRGANTSSLAGMKAFAIPFFVMHYGIFWLVHGVFVLIALPLMASDLAGGDASTPFDPWRSLPLVALGALGLGASHLVSFVVNYVGRREYERTNPVGQMTAPYARVVVLHVTIVLGAALVGILGSPVALLLLLVALKTLLDLALHLREHLGLSAGRATLEGPMGRVTVG